MYRWYNDSSGFHPFTGDGGFSFFAGKFGLHIGHNNMMFQNYGSSVSCGVIRDIMILFLYDARGKRSELRSRLHDKVFDFGIRGTLNRPGGFL